MEKLVIFVFVLLLSPIAMSLTWSSTGDWDNALSQSRVVHESTGDLSSGEIRKGYSANNPIGSNLLVSHRFDSNSGSTSYDSAGSNDGTLNGSKGSTGILGTDAFDINGGNVVLKRDFPVSDNENVTVSAWIYFPYVFWDGSGGSGNDARKVFSNFNSNTGAGFILHHENHGYWGDNWKWQVENTGGSWQGTRFSSNSTSPGWHYFVGTIDATNEIALYWDSVKKDSNGLSSANLADHAIPHIGSAPDGSNPWKWIIDEVRVYNSALTSAQIQSMYQTATQQGSLTTGWKSFSSNRDMNSLQLENVQASLNGGSITVYVETQNGEVSDPISLDGSGGPYSVTGLSTKEDQFRLDIRLNNSNVTSTPTLSAINLTGNKPNSPPNSPSSENPADNSDPVSLSPSLSVLVDDPDGDSMNVTFYVDTNNDGSYETTKTNTGVASGSTTSVSLSSLATSQTVNWYVVADDGTASTTSNTWNFTTVSKPNAPFNPTPSNADSTVPPSQNLKVDVTHPDGLPMDVSFYLDKGRDGDTDQTLTANNVSDGGTASVSPTLADGTQYSWHTEARTDSYTTSKRSTGEWNFTTTVSALSVQLTWKDNSNNEAGFKIYSNSSGTMKQIAEVNTDITSYTDNSNQLEPGKTVKYRVTAYNRFGESTPATGVITP